MNLHELFPISQEKTSCRFKIGQKVFLKTGGPVLTVVDFFEKIVVVADANGVEQEFESALLYPAS